MMLHVRAQGFIVSTRQSMISVIFIDNIIMFRSYKALIIYTRQNSLSDVKRGGQEEG